MPRPYVLAGMVLGALAGLFQGPLVLSGCVRCPAPEPIAEGDYVIVDASLPETIGGTVSVSDPWPDLSGRLLVIRYSDLEIEYLYNGG